MKANLENGWASRLLALRKPGTSVAAAAKLSSSFGTCAVGETFALREGIGNLDALYFLRRSIPTAADRVYQLGFEFYSAMQTALLSQNRSASLDKAEAIMDEIQELSGIRGAA